MKTAKEVFDEKYEFYRNMENKPPIPLEARELIFQAMEQYHEARMKEECCHPFERVISAGALHNCTVCGQNIEVKAKKLKNKSNDGLCPVCGKSLTYYDVEAYCHHCKLPR